MGIGAGIGFEGCVRKRAAGQQGVPGGAGVCGCEKPAAGFAGPAQEVAAFSTFVVVR